MARFVIQNFGCRATQADGAALEAQLQLLRATLVREDQAPIRSLFETARAWSTRDA